MAATKELLRLRSRIYRTARTSEKKAEDNAKIEAIKLADSVRVKSVAKARYERNKDQILIKQKKSMT